MLNEQIENLEKLILDIPCMPEMEQSKCSASDLTAITGEIMTSDSKGEKKLNDPVYIKPKGRIKKTWRQKSIVEEIISRPKVTCSGCNKQGHNITGCKQIEQESPEKPKKTGKTTNIVSISYCNLYDQFSAHFNPVNLNLQPAERMQSNIERRQQNKNR